MLPLWHLRVEMTVCAGDFPSANTIGFRNILLRAETAASAERKLGNYFAEHGWSIVKVEQASVLEHEFVAKDDEFADLVERAREHSDPIILGTFHSYKTT